MYNPLKNFFFHFKEENKTWFSQPHLHPVGPRWGGGESRPVQRPCLRNAIPLPKAYFGKLSSFWLENRK